MYPEITMYSYTNDVDYIPIAGNYSNVVCVPI